MNVFLINLEDNKERFQFMDRQLKEMSIPYEKISAVYGKKLSKLEKERCVNRFRWQCAIGRSIVDAEIGCALSHQKIYQQMIEKHIEFACILEDDVELSNNFKDGLSVISGFLDSTKPQVILLSDHSKIYKNMKLKDGFDIIQSSKGMCTDGYCLTLKAARVLSQQVFPLIVPCDTWRRWVKLGKIELFHLLPSVCKQNQDDFGSMTSVGHINVSSFSVFKKIIYKIRRFCEKTIDTILQWWTKR